MRFSTSIEGMRGLAVALVVLAHAGLPGFASGFIGVDVFFVISGFLITSLLAEELEASGRIDPWQFYARRVRRLAPAMIVMLLVTMMLARMLLPGPGLALQAESGFWAALWLSNFLFAFNEFGYFSDGAKGSLYLHTWSLGVEEQFYLLWPAVIAIAWKGIRGRGRAWVFRLFSGCTAACYVAALVAYQHFPIESYYLMPTRLWELSAGAAAALAVPLAPGHRLRGLAAPTGVLLLLAGLALAQPDAPALFWKLAIVVAGTALLLVSISDSPGMGTRWLDSRALRFLGRISYGVYLWHWPLLGIAALAWGGRPEVRIAAVIVAVLAAWASAHWVEEPIRRLRTANGKAHVLLGLLASLSVALMFRAWWNPFESKGGEAPLSNAEYISRQASFSSIYARGCDDWYASDRLKPCLMADPPAPTRELLLVGDSVGAQWEPALREIAVRRGWRLVVLTKSSCPIVDVEFFYPPVGRNYDECTSWRKRVVAYVNRAKPDSVLIGSSASNGLGPARWRDGTRSFVESISAASGEILVIAPTPILPFKGLECLIRNNGGGAIGEVDSRACGIALREVEPVQIKAALREGVAGTGNARVVDLNPLVCPAGTCMAWHDGQLVYRDAQHLSAGFAYSQGPRVEALASFGASQRGADR